MAMYFGDWNGSSVSPSIYAFNPEKARVISLGITPFKGIHDVVNLPQAEFAGSNFVHVVNDTLTVGLEMNPAESVRLFAYDNRTGKTEVFDDTFEYNERNRFYASQKILAVDNGGCGYCCAYFNMPWLVIRDENFNIRRRVAIGEKLAPETIEGDFAGGFNGFSSLTYHGGHILALFNERGERPKSRLLFFSNSGEPEASLDMGNAMWFTIDSRGRIIATHYDSSDDEVLITVTPLPDKFRE